MKRSKVAADSIPVTGRRKSREDWIAAARKVLVTSGVDSVKVDRLANDLRATRGSFYWHFADRDDLLNALLHDWEVNNYVAISTIRARWASSAPDLTELVELWVGEGTESPAFGMAIRTWARGDAKVEDVMHRVDNEWISLVQLLFSPDIYDPSERLVRARVVYFHQVGYHALALREPPEERLRLIPYYYKVLMGREAGDNLLSTLRALERSEPETPSKTRRVKARSKATSTRLKRS
ncbi:TetR/AcrR family transcriptional regulator [Steroidobacter cummioxidans]|uniref:TetR/AcrR family transcriptional regulator n=1 Tax=Steroidobacter cummioxidans TaxID=1803913 RepID=UPI0013795A23|nr:TetR/AcrR family transcriptional regulator [Steroidobacter cummioxidans]